MVFDIFCWSKNQFLVRIRDGRYDAGAWIEFVYNVFLRLRIASWQIYRSNLYFVRSISRQANFIKIFDNFSFMAFYWVFLEFMTITFCWLFVRSVWCRNLFWEVLVCYFADVRRNSERTSDTRCSVESSSIRWIWVRFCPEWLFSENIIILKFSLFDRLISWFLRTVGMMPHTWLCLILRCIAAFIK